MWSEARKHTVPHKKKTIIAIQELQCEQNLGPVWQGFGSSKNSSGSGSSDGAVSLVELEPF